MPKLKTHSGVKKRFRRTGSGKITARKAGQVHNLQHKSGSRRRRAGKGLVWEGASAEKYDTLLR